MMKMLLKQPLQYVHGYLSEKDSDCS
jgi:hypothetical protein